MSHSPRRLTRALLAFLTLSGAACTGKKADATPAAPPAAGSAPVAKPPLPGTDFDGLMDSDIRAFWRMVEKYPSACGKAQSLEASVRADPSCKRSQYAVRYIIRLMKAHLLPSEVEEAYDQRYNAERANLDVKDAPMRGQASAPITLVEFADFQCPHCKHLATVLEKLLDDYHGQVKLYYKNYPISASHPDSAVAAAAALAAGKQGKFWAFHDKLFASDQLHEDMSVLEKYAKDLKLDMTKWRADTDAEKAQVEADHSQGEHLGIDSTPTLYINGRKHNGPNSYEDVKDWIDEELNK